MRYRYQHELWDFILERHPTNHDLFRAVRGMNSKSIGHINTYGRSYGAWGSDYISPMNGEIEFIAKHPKNKPRSRT